MVGTVLRQLGSASERMTATRGTAKPRIVDAFPAFEKFWESVRNEPLTRQLERWEVEYMQPWPELLEKLKENYTTEGVDWRRVARKQVFPHFGSHLDRMRELHHDLLETLPTSWARARRVLELRFPVAFVIYVGIGCGAGWATTYEGRPACLFGLENAAENHGGGDGWSRRIVAHEMAHLAHQVWRGDRGEQSSDPWWTLYEEGFATYCERKLEPRLFALRTGKGDWLPWCEERRPWLARKFLRDVRERRSLRPFFGSWYDVGGYIETGYYLGLEMIGDWAHDLPLRALATLPRTELRRRARATLRRFAESGAPPQDRTTS